MTTRSTRRGWHWLHLVLSILVVGVGMNAVEAAGAVTWKEEVQLHDGRKMIVERSQSYGGRHEIGQTPPIREQEITFAIPGTNEQITWKAEFGEDVGRSNFILLALHVLGDTPYLVAEPHLCLAYNKWGRPNPPYVIFMHKDKKWKRTRLEELPMEFKDINLVISTKTEEKSIVSQRVVSAELVAKLNSRLDQPEYRAILRQPMADSMLCPPPLIELKAPYPIPAK